MKTKKLSYTHLVYILFAVFYLWLAAQIPYTHDDWDWGLEIGMQQWLTASVNSRYVGNFFEIIMTRSVFLKTVIMGGAFFLLPYLLSCIAARQEKHTRPTLFLAANLLILTMSRLIWSETYGWVAGFANFGLSSVFMLLCIHQWLPLCESEYSPVKHRSSVNFFLLLISFAGQLFIENLSIVMAGLSLLACVASYIRAKKIPTHYIFMAIGMIVGLTVMFSSSVYTSLFGSGEAVDGYRQLIVNGESSLMTKLYNLFVQAARLATRAGEANFILCMSVMAILTYKLIEQSPKNAIHKILLGINLLFEVYFTVNFLLQTDYTPDKLLRSAFAATVNALYFVAVPLEVLLIYKGNAAMQKRLIAIWFIGIALLAPLVVTNEAGYRLIFSLIIMVSLFILFILQDIISAFHQKRITTVFLAAAIMPVIACTIVYSAIGHCNRLRLELMEMADFYDADEITLPTYPYENYLHAPDPIDQIRMGYFKEFYGIDSNVTVIIDTAE